MSCGKFHYSTPSTFGSKSTHQKFYQLDQLFLYAGSSSLAFPSLNFFILPFFTKEDHLHKTKLLKYASNKLLCIFLKTVLNYLCFNIAIFSKISFYYQHGGLKTRSKQKVSNIFNQLPITVHRLTPGVSFTGLTHLHKVVRCLEIDVKFKTNQVVTIPPYCNMITI